MSENQNLTGLGLQDLLALLQLPPEPPPVSMWPQTAAWLYAAVIVLILLGVLIWKLRQRWRANAYRRAALRELARIGDDAAAISSVLRRTALAAFPRKDVANLHGDAWLAFLDEHGRGIRFRQGAGEVLRSAPYQRPSDTGGTELRDLAVRWVRTHRKP